MCELCKAEAAGLVGGLCNEHGCSLTDSCEKCGARLCPECTETLEAYDGSGPTRCYFCATDLVDWTPEELEAWRARELVAQQGPMPPW